MTDTAPREGEPSRRRFYDVEPFLAMLRQQHRQLSTMRLLLRKLVNALDSFQGFFITLGLTLPTMLVLPGVVVVRAYYGPIAALALVAGVLGGVGSIVHVKVGRSLSFSDYSLGRRILAQIVVFAIVGGLFYIVAYLIP